MDLNIKSEFDGQRLSLSAYDGDNWIGALVCRASTCLVQNSVLEEVHVVESHQRQGVGRALVERSYELLRGIEQHLSYSTLYCYSNMTPFYEKLGYKAVFEFAPTDTDPYPLLMMVRALGAFQCAS